MAGLAAALNAPKSIDALAWALSARGEDGAVSRLTGSDGLCLDLAVRAAMPSITRVVAADGNGDADATLVAALIIDGIASVTALDRDYAENGPAGLVDGGDLAYAVVLADAEAGELVLARNGAGPTLYYARLDDGWVVASEPGALVHAGVSAEPDVAVIRRFISTGTCDEVDRTFYAKIRRVLPDEAVVLSTSVNGPIRHPVPRVPANPSTVEDAIWAAGAVSATSGGSAGVLVMPGVAGAAVLGSVLHQPGRPQPLPAFTVTVAGLGPEQPGALASLQDSAVRHTALTATLDLSTVDKFLAEMGEPVPDLGTYLLWIVARELSGGVDTLVDSTMGSAAARERIADRMLSHFGVTVHAPLRGAKLDDQVLTDIVERSLPPVATRQALEDPARTVSSAAVVHALGDDVAAALVPPRPWSDAAASVTALRRLHAGEQADADALLRAFFVERWLVGLGPDAEVPAGEVAEIRPQVTWDAPTLRPSDEVRVGGDTWRRTPVRTAPIAPGDQLLANTAFYVVNALTAHRELPVDPWFAVISGKVVSVSQDRVDPLISVAPGRWARALARLVRRRYRQLALPEAMQVAINQCGLWRMIGTALLGRSLPAEAAVYAPRAGAMPPSDAAVVWPPAKADEAAESLLSAMRMALRREYARTLAGVAVVSANEGGCRVLGFAAGPAADTVPRARTLLSLALADNPAGQGMERTPIVIVARQSAVPVLGSMRRSPVVDEDARASVPAVVPVVAR